MGRQRRPLQENLATRIRLAQPPSDGTLLATLAHWRGGRAVDRAGLENRKAERPREFESHPLRASSIALPVNFADNLFSREQMKIRTSVRLAGRGSAWVKIPPLRDLSPKPKRSFG
jgi:hypothetical protein